MARESEELYESVTIRILRHTYGYDADLAVALRNAANKIDGLRIIREESPKIIGCSISYIPAPDEEFPELASWRIQVTELIEIIQP